VDGSWGRLLTPAYQARRIAAALAAISRPMAKGTAGLVQFKEAREEAPESTQFPEEFQQMVVKRKIKEAIQVPIVAVKRYSNGTGQL
jgi:hypothetical protein